MGCTTSLYDSWTWSGHAKGFCPTSLEAHLVMRNIYTFFGGVFGLCVVIRLSRVGLWYRPERGVGPIDLSSVGSIDLWPFSLGPPRFVSPLLQRRVSQGLLGMWKLFMGETLSLKFHLRLLSYSHIGPKSALRFVVHSADTENRFVSSLFPNFSVPGERYAKIFHKNVKHKILLIFLLHR